MSTSNVNSVMNGLVNLYEKRNWREILNLKQSQSAEFDWVKLIWVWPEEENLKFIAKYVQQFGLSEVCSVGCGTGLFEWLLSECTGINVTGIEVDELWWKCPHSPPQFIPINYIGLNEIVKTQSTTALMFCYFNDGDVFQQYIQEFSGQLVIIIGPGPGRGTHTNPTPFSPDFGNSHEWKLLDSQEIGRTKDFIAIYVKC